MAHASRAWLLHVAGDRRVAAGAAHVVEYLLDPEPLPIPLTPRHCAGLMLWRDRIIPVIDLAPMFGARRTTAARRAIILAYQEAPGRPLRHGGLLVEAAPVEIQVTDDMAGPLPELNAAFRSLVRACFLHQDRPVPVIDVLGLFARPLPDLATPVDPPDTGAVEMVEETLAHRVQAARAEIPRLLPAAVNIEMWKSLDTSPAITTSHDDFSKPIADTGIVACDSVVIPFSSGSVSPGESGQRSDTPPAATGSTVPAVSASPAEAAGLVADRHRTDAKRPSTLQSFRQLRDLERRHQMRNRSARPRWAMIAGVPLAILVLAMYLLSGPARDRAAPAPRDTSPGAIRPVAVPSAPTQPPQ